MRPLSRRSLFALPVALPVAAVAAKVGVAAKVRSLWGGVLSPSAIRRVENLKPLPFSLEKLYAPGESPFLFLKTTLVPWRKSDAVDTVPNAPFRSAWPPAKFTDDELAATLGLDTTKSCGGGGNSAGYENIGDRLCTGRQPSPPPSYDSDGVRLATGGTPGPHDALAQPAVA